MGKKSYFQVKEESREITPDEEEVQGITTAESLAETQEEFIEAELVMTNLIAEQWLKNAGLRKVEAFSSIRFAVESEDTNLERMAAFLAEKALRKEGRVFVQEKQRSLGVFNRMVRVSETAGSLVALKKPDK